MRRRESHILWKAFERNLARAGRCFLGLVGGVLDKSALQHVVRFVARIPALAPLDRPAEFERHSVDSFGCEPELVAFELAILKK